MKQLKTVKDKVLFYGNKNEIYEIYEIYVFK